MVNAWPAAVLRRSDLAISKMLVCVADSKKKELIKRSGKKRPMCSNWTGYFLATAGPRLVKKAAKMISYSTGIWNLLIIDGERWW